MKTLGKLFLVLLLSGLARTNAYAQVDGLIKDGSDLDNQGNHTAAIAKYAEALKAESENGYANYKMAFALYASKKANEAIPYLEKAVKTSSVSLVVPEYVLLATIYDEGKQPQKAIETYSTAIKINPDYPQIYYNQGLAYFRNKQYAEAENCAIEAIKRDPKNASDQRLYALVTFHQNKLCNALLGFCSFLLIEPNGPRAAEAFSNIQNILAAGGTFKDVNGNSSSFIVNNGEPIETRLNFALSMVIKAGVVKKLQGMDLLEYQFKNIFVVANQLTEKDNPKTFFEKFYVEYLYKLSQSGNIPAFTRTASLSANKTENAKWLKDNAKQAQDLADWVAKTEREF
jgi:tetratricopeptide (TPR) repeat protein